VRRPEPLRAPPPVTRTLQLGLRENLAQFSLLVVVNAFVGAMVGMERSILPAIAEEEFELAGRTAILSFIVVFGVTKAITNYFAGRFSDRWGRKIVLVAGWLVAAPVPFALMWAPSWFWILAANVLLGVSQGLTWSTTVIMKIDLAGPKKRGLAMGLNDIGERDRIYQHMQHLMEQTGCYRFLAHSVESLLSRTWLQPAYRADGYPMYREFKLSGPDQV